MDNNSRFMPILLIDGVVPFPNSKYTFSVEQESLIEGVKAALGMDNKILIANAKKFDEGIVEGNIYRIGVVGKIEGAMRILDGVLKITVSTSERGFINSIQRHSDFTLCQVDSITEINSDVERADVSKDILMDLFNNFRAEIPVQPLTSKLVKEAEDVGQLCDVLGDKVVRAFDDKRKILEETDIYERTVVTIAFMEKEIERANVKNEIMNRARANMEEAQKEYFLREELKAINEELGDKSGVGEEINGYREKMKKLNMPQYAVDKLEKEFERLKRSQQGAQEGSVIRDYIDNVLSLPWGIYSKESKDLKKAERILNKDHYGLEKVKERIVEFLAVKAATDNINAPILCLVGPPGVGKTSIAKSMARALGREYVRMSLGGISDEAEIRGHRRTYLGAMPGRIIAAMRQAGASNPLILLDEIDKIGKDYKGDPAAAFLEILDAEQNVNFRDNYLEMPYDLSKVLFICTANSLDTIPGPLRDRLEIVELSSYTAEEKQHIAEEFLIPKQLKANGLTKSQLRFKKDAVADMIESYTREAGVRSLERLVGAVCRKVVKERIHSTKLVTITKKNITDYLGRRRFKPETINAKDEVGICRGLAWTSVGGCTLSVEVNILKGKGNFKITGNVGKVMEESYNAALSYIRANAEELGVDIDFEHTDVHIHIPEGAVPKDGPSAGITMATAILSAVTNRAVRPDVAMTGEITLRGRVLAIGGLKEKLLAAKAAGATLVFVPADNRADYEELTDEVTTGLCVRFVTHMREVIKEVFEA